MADYKTPGVYIEEISTLPPSVGQVPTAVPAFIGYTERATRAGKSLLNIPRHVTSLLDYHQMFGAAPHLGKISVKLDGDYSVDSVEFENKYYLYNSIRMFFANGGGECYIVSVGSYADDVSFDALSGGLAVLEKEDHPTMLLCPDAMLIEKSDQAYSLQQAMLMQCNKLQDRVAVLDVFEGYKDRADEDVVLNFRSGIGVNFLKYGAAYYPWVQSTLSTSFGFENILLKDKDGEDINLGDLVDDSSIINNVKTAITDVETITAFVANPLGSDASLDVAFYKVDEAAVGTADELKQYAEVIKQIIDKIIEFKGAGLVNGLVENELKIKVNSSGPASNICRGLAAIDASAAIGVVNKDSDYPDYGITGASDAMYADLDDATKHKKAVMGLKALFEETVELMLAIKADTKKIKESLDKSVYDTSALYKSIVNDVQKEAAMLPPGGAIAGVYAQVDADRGVWKAPANVSLAATAAPWVKLDNQQQEDLNVDVNAGKSINAIRPFTGKGTLVWGARTLAGNDNEWRYISVRRFFNMVEQSVKLSTGWAVFEPNDVNTWIRVKAMIENYLTNLWKAGALAGPTPDAAFFVNIGLGTTMSAVDILEGRMNIEIGMAAVRPAEFIILKFSHKLQEG
ncbi:MAG: phage tail sheath protein FI [Arenicella sp.]|jgi:phage tail sheath protein FI